MKIHPISQLFSLRSENRIVHRTVSDRTPCGVRMYTAWCPIVHRSVYDGGSAFGRALTLDGDNEE